MQQLRWALPPPGSALPAGAPAAPRRERFECVALRDIRCRARIVPDESEAAGQRAGERWVLVVHWFPVTSYPKGGAAV